jgi:hypothetical protein
VTLTGRRRREVYRVYSHEAFLAGGSDAEPLERAAAREQVTLRLLVGAALPLGLVAATVAVALDSARHRAPVALDSARHRAPVAHVRGARVAPARNWEGGHAEHRRRSHETRSIRTTTRAVARSRRDGSRSHRLARGRLAAARPAASPAALASTRSSRPSQPASESQGPEFLFER